MTQRQLAKALGKNAHTMVVRVESGERRLDVVEAYRWFRALGADPADELAKLMKTLEADELGPSSRSDDPQFGTTDH